MTQRIILFGGRSDERHVSVASAQNLARITPTALCWFWAPDGAVHDVAPAELIAHANPFDSDYLPSRPAIWPDLEQALDTMPVEEPVVVLALHGGEGEDGTVQRLLERRRIAFTGSGADASAAAFDKGRAKEVVAGRVHLAESRIVRTPEELRRGLREMLMRHEQIVLKPLAGGSSRGLFFLDRDGDADAVTASVIANGVPYVVEEFLRGRELTVGVIERPSGECVALPVIEIEVDPGFTFDYAGKYHGSGTREICPARIPDALRDEAQRTAIAAHEALGCRGYSRSDLIAAESGVVFLELNTLPGLTTSSLVPQQLVAAGMTMQQFVEEQITLAMRRARDESRRELAS